MKIGGGSILKQLSIVIEVNTEQGEYVTEKCFWIFWKGVAWKQRC